MNNQLNNEKGLTLVELLAVIVIGGIILAFSTSLIVQAMNNQERIMVESQLRDEADIIMAKLTKSIFTLKESEIIQFECSTTTSPPCTTEILITDNEASSLPACRNIPASTNFTAIKVRYKLPDDSLTTCIDEISIKDKTIYTKNDTYTITNKNIALDPIYSLQYNVQKYAVNGSEVSHAERVSVIVSFTLTHKLKGISRTFHNEIVTVDDI